MIDEPSWSERVLVTSVSPAETRVSRDVLVSLLVDAEAECRECYRRLSADETVPCDVVASSRSEWLQVIEVLAWARAQRGANVLLGIYPVDPDAEREWLEAMALDISEDIENIEDDDPSAGSLPSST